MIKSKGLITSSLFLALLVSILSCVQTQEVDPISPYSEPIVTDSVEQNAIASLDEEVLSTETKEEQNKALDFTKSKDIGDEESQADVNIIASHAESNEILDEVTQSEIVVPSGEPVLILVESRPASELTEQPSENLHKSLLVKEESSVASVPDSPLQAEIPTFATSLQEPVVEENELTNLESTEGAQMPNSLILPILFIISVVILTILFILLKAAKTKLKNTNQNFKYLGEELDEARQMLVETKNELSEKRERLRYSEEELSNASRRILELGITDIESAKSIMEGFQKEIQTLEAEVANLYTYQVELKGKNINLSQELQKLDTRIANQSRKLIRARELSSAVEHAVERFFRIDIPTEYYRPLTDEEKVDIDSIAPSVMLNLNYMNYQELRKEFRANQKQIESLLEEYAQRYTTKANQSIYKLMVIALRSELQNILYNLKHEKLDNALFQVQSLISKYLVIVSDGNQQIAGTMRKFIGELEHLFDSSVRIEYEYYIKKEQARQEQLALRQQMREEAEERKRLEEQKKQVALEESKYQAEIEKIQDLLAQEPEDSERRADIEAKLQELNVQLDLVEEKKEEITKLQNGKAGNVYIISNLGSFGDKVFKVGMTRRLDPQERVDELGSASVPFKFDVHSFIFSEDAVGLENEMHNRLRARRLNKVNLRKEFFEVSLDELEQIVLDINPTAAFNRTMLAEDYKQSLSLGEEEIPLSNSDDTIEQSDEDDPDNGEND